MNTKTQTAVITGAGSGIGFAVAEAFIGQGANVVLNGRSEDKLARAAALLGRPDRVAVVAGDVTEGVIGGGFVAVSEALGDLRDVPLAVTVTVPTVVCLATRTLTNPLT